MKYKDLATKLGVSPATVSLVINNKPGISDKTRASVLGAINRMGYGHLIRREVQPPPPPSGRSRTVGFILYKNGGELLGYNSFFPLILGGIERAARKRDYNLSVINIEKQEVDRQIQYITESGCDGCVIFATEMHREDIDIFQELQMPIVLFDNFFPDVPFSCVKVDNAQGTRLSAQYLYSMGHRKIGYLGSGLAINSFEERRQSAKEALMSLGIDSMERYSHTIGYPSENAYEGMKALLHSGFELPTAFMADNDLVSVGAMKAAREMGYALPDDLSFVGFDDRPICDLVEPNLTTIQLPRNEFGSVAVEQLIRQLEDDESGDGQTFHRITIGISGTLIVRNSVADLS